MRNFRIYLGLNDKNGKKVPNKKVNDFIKLFGEKFEGFTVLNAIGYWKGSKEKCLIIELLADSEKAQTIKDLAKFYKELTSQDCVLITSQKIETDWVAWVMPPCSNSSMMFLSSPLGTTKVSQI